jgi:hypothetical protein
LLLRYTISETATELGRLFISSDLKYREIVFPTGSHFEGLQEAYAGFTAAYSEHDRSPQIFVRQEFDFQAGEVSSLTHREI